MTKKLGICIVGCGYMGQIHARGWQSIPEAKVVVVVDLQVERAQTLAQQLACDFETDYERAVARTDVQAVSVCIPTSLHPAVTITAANAGKHILCEKPISLTITDTDEMISAAKLNQVKLGVGFMRRHSPILPDLKNTLASSKLEIPL